MARIEYQSVQHDYIKQSLERLEHAVHSIHDSESFRAYLTAQAKFHRYSWRNVLLILSQCPEATHVAGYRTWQSLGRQVKQGEKAISILAPASVTKKERDEQTGDDSERRVAFFRGASVFNLSQTEGKPLPEVAVPVLDSGAGAELYARLEGVALTEGLRVTIGHEAFLWRPQMMGFYQPDARAIYVREAAQLQQTKTLAHELAHHFGGGVSPSAEEETTAESVAYVVCACFGLDTGARSFPYVAVWSQDPRVFNGALARIQRASARIIERLEQRSDQRSELTTATL